MMFEAPTRLQEIEIIFKIVTSTATAIAVIVGGAWAYFRFRRQRENFPLIDFTADVKFHKKLGNWWIVELITHIENKGKVQHKLDYFMFDLYSLNRTDKIDTSDEIGGQVFFPNKLVESSFLPKKNKYFFIEPGSKNKYSYVTRVPVEAEVIILHSWFNYLDGEHSHTAEVTSKVPKNGEGENAEKLSNEASI